MFFCVDVLVYLSVILLHMVMMLNVIRSCITIKNLTWNSQPLRGIIDHIKHLGPQKSLRKEHKVLMYYLNLLRVRLHVGDLSPLWSIFDYLSMLFILIINHKSYAMVVDKRPKIKFIKI